MAPRAISDAEERRRRRVYEATKTDPQAARRLGITVNAFLKWRLRERIAPKTPTGRPVPADAEETRREVIRSSRDMHEAARRLGMDESTLYRWTRVRGIARPWPHGARRPKD